MSFEPREATGVSVCVFVCAWLHVYLTCSNMFLALVHKASLWNSEALTELIFFVKVK